MTPGPSLLARAGPGAGTRNACRDTSHPAPTMQPPGTQSARMPLCGVFNLRHGPWPILRCKRVLQGKFLHHAQQHTSTSSTRKNDMPRPGIHAHHPDTSRNEFHDIRRKSALQRHFASYSARKGHELARRCPPKWTRFRFSRHAMRFKFLRQHSAGTRPRCLSCSRGRYPLKPSHKTGLNSPKPRLGATGTTAGEGSTPALQSQPGTPESTRHRQKPDGSR
ncbi:hypothetical protein GGQ74_000459 [Desulfobaculum xiamenense]|uniref:Uncharacterized protein n=1 Tax=Desulfobaculum xiamenense TaxID=995050 RepID=A0A846QQ55_9BACT|nr:hypothetical protein [Desulfobaculum xiamenense]